MGPNDQVAVQNTMNLIDGGARISSVSDPEHPVAEGRYAGLGLAIEEHTAITYFSMSGQARIQKTRQVHA